MQAKTQRVAPHVATADFTRHDTVADGTRDSHRNGKLQLSGHNAPQRSEETGSVTAVRRQRLTLEPRNGATHERRRQMRLR